jgi:hypothetical protein
MQPAELPDDVRTICTAFVGGLIAALAGNLHGVYLYGALVWQEAGRAHDIDAHVILRRVPTDVEIAAILAVHADLAKRFSPLGAELDAYYVLLEDAKKTSPPRHRLRAAMHDAAWALHCAHVRAGRCITLHGPEPSDIFPSPTWPDIASALDQEMRYIAGNFRDPAYCILNLCRVVYSFLARDAVVTKRSCGRWARSRYPQWAPAIEAAARSYDDQAIAQDDELMKEATPRFFSFASQEIARIRVG